MTRYRTGASWGVTIVHEGDGPASPDGRRDGDQLAAVVVNGDQQLAERIVRGLALGALSEQLTPAFAYLRLDPRQLKSTREALCAAQSALGQRASDGVDTDRMPIWTARIQSLISQIDLHRPLGSGGKHGDLHTRTCGCEDQP